MLGEQGILYEDSQNNSKQLPYLPSVAAGVRHQEEDRFSIVGLHPHPWHDEEAVAVVMWYCRRLVQRTIFLGDLGHVIVLLLINTFMLSLHTHSPHARASKRTPV